ncbi:MAG: hypothetical protein IJP84_11130 [Lachnospiraceae bacterium]|nr:hypothetical protein [Clostridia bacterium]MBQ6968439.1 hypothetical protein [Lachnospiraceae bacterium]
MEKRQVIENLNKSLQTLKKDHTVTLSDKSLKTLRDSIEEALNLLGNDLPKDTSDALTDKTSDATDETIDHLGLSKRSSNALKRAGLMTLKDLRGITTDNLKSIRGLGETSLKEITEKAEEQGVKISS